MNLESQNEQEQKQIYLKANQFQNVNKELVFFTGNTQKENTANWPKLLQVAKPILCRQPSLANTEKAFSIASFAPQQNHGKTYSLAGALKCDL